MRRKSLKGAAAFLAAAVLSAACAFASWASDSSAGSSDGLPFEMVLDINSRKTQVYDGYSQYVDGWRVCPEDTFHLYVPEKGVDLSQVVLDYMILSYGEEGTQVLQEFTIQGLEENENYPVVRSETIARESARGKLYDNLNRCYTLRFTYGGQSETYYFHLVPEEDMEQYRNLLRGSWKRGASGNQYFYGDEYIRSWGLINGTWYYFGDDGYQRKGWLEYKGQWYFLDRDSGEMRTSCTIDGYTINSDGVRV